MIEKGAGPPLGCNGLILAKAPVKIFQKEKVQKNSAQDIDPRHSKYLNRSLNMRNTKEPGRRRLVSGRCSENKKRRFSKGMIS